MVVALVSGTATPLPGSGFKPELSGVGSLVEDRVAATPTTYIAEASFSSTQFYCMGSVMR